MSDKRYSYKDVVNEYARKLEKPVEGLPEKEQSDIQRYVVQNGFDLDSKDDVSYVAGAYLRDRLDKLPLYYQLFSADSTEQNRAQTEMGSLQTLIAYIGLQPLVLEARKEILGTTEPLPLTEVKAWLFRESEKGREHKYRMLSIRPLAKVGVAGAR